MVINRAFCAVLICATTICISANCQTLQPINQSSQTPPPAKQQLTRNATSKTQTSEKNAPYKMTARYHLQQDATTGYLILQFELPKGSYIYSLTQGGELLPSKIEVAPSNQYRTKGKFNPDSPPSVVEKDPVFKQRVEKHKGRVQFFVPFEVRPDTDLKQIQPELIFNGQVCSNQGICMPIRRKSVKAKFAGYFQRTAEKRDNSQSNKIK